MDFRNVSDYLKVYRRRYLEDLLESVFAVPLVTEPWIVCFVHLHVGRLQRH
jgi:hypothetical protein